MYLVLWKEPSSSFPPFVVRLVEFEIVVAEWRVFQEDETTCIRPELVEGRAGNLDVPARGGSGGGKVDGVA